MAPDLEEQRFRLGQTVGVDELPIIEPETSPEVIHEHREARHNGKYTPWTTKLVTGTRCESTEIMRRGPSNIRVMFIEFLVPLLAFVGDFDDVFFFGRLRRPLTHVVRRAHGGWYSGEEEEEFKRKTFRDRTILLIGSLRHFRVFDATRFLMAVMSEIGIPVTLADWV